MAGARQSGSAPALLSRGRGKIEPIAASRDGAPLVSFDTVMTLDGARAIPETTLQQELKMTVSIRNLVAASAFAVTGLTAVVTIAQNALAADAMSHDTMKRDSMSNGPSKPAGSDAMSRDHMGKDQMGKDAMSNGHATTGAMGHNGGQSGAMGHDAMT
jgi:pentapeptide MXKDX repeat protein